MQKDAKAFVNSGEQYFSGGEEEIEISAKVEGKNSPVFPWIETDM